MQNKNIVTKNVIYGIAGLTLLILAISFGAQTHSNAKLPPKMNVNNSNTSIFENNAHQGQNYVKLLAQDMKNRLEKDAAILELTGMLPEVKNLASVNMLDQPIGQSKGIPQNADIPKREVAKDILEKYGEFQVVFFLKPNGDIYMEEPYSLQKNLSKTNFAFRDYYKGVIANNDTFLGNVIVSASSGQKQAVMAEPIYSGPNGSLTGIWAGGLNMSKFNENLQFLNLANNERIVYVDNLGQVVADSDVNKSKTSESLNTLQSFKNAINGQSGSIVDTVNNTKMLVTYQPVKAFHNTWAVLLMQPLLLQQQ
ncbi:MAG: cache domain-containing protein [Candidatus Nitrosocosmicus sp.]